MAEERNFNNFKGVIIANKSDLFLKEEVSEKEARDFAKNHYYQFYYTSAKNEPIKAKNVIEKIIKDYISSSYYDY